MTYKKQTIAFVLLAITMSLTACSKRTDSSQSRKPGPVQRATHSVETLAVIATPGGENQHVSPGPIPTKDAEQILEDISSASVKEKTHNLEQTYGQLDDICDKAIGTCTALLSASYVTDQHRELITKKEVSQ